MRQPKILVENAIENCFFHFRSEILGGTFPPANWEIRSHILEEFGDGFAPDWAIRKVQWRIKKLLKNLVLTE